MADGITKMTSPDIERLKWEVLKNLSELVELEPFLYNKPLNEVIETLKNQEVKSNEFDIKKQR